MFHVITEQIEKPAFMLLCDNMQCGFQASKTIAAEADLELQANIFLQQVAQAKWAVTIMGQFCPAHNPNIAAEQKLVKVATSMPSLVC